MDIRLKHPIIVNGVKTSDLVLGRFKTKHLKLLPEKFLRSITSRNKKKAVITLEIFPKLIPLIASLLEIKEEEV